MFFVRGSPLECAAEMFLYSRLNIGLFQQYDILILFILVLILLYKPTCSCVRDTPTFSMTI